MKTENFAIFILTYGRADNVITYTTLKKTDYKGKIYFIVSDDDKEVQKYKKNFGDKNVIVFSKDEIAKTFDEMDNFPDQRSVIYARNACFDIARKLGIEYFLMLDDDYSAFYYRYNHKLDFITKRIYNIEKVLDYLVDYYKTIPAKAIAMAQGGDYIGGDNGFAFAPIRLRKVMNTFICSPSRQFEWKGKLNDDVNTYTHHSRMGSIFLTIPWVAVIQKETQHNEGGLTDIYLNYGTYVKSFYTVMISPSSVTIALMGRTNRRIHHRIQANNHYPMIIDEKYK